METHDQETSRGNITLRKAGLGSWEYRGGAGFNGSAARYTSYMHTIIIHDDEYHAITAMINDLTDWITRTYMNTQTRGKPSHSLLQVSLATPYINA